MSSDLKINGARLHSIMLCDLMRREQGGGRILIGCYGDTIILRKKPAIFSGRVVGGFQIDAGFLSEIEYKVETPTMRGEGKFIPPPEAFEDPSSGYASFDAPFRALVESAVDNVQFMWRVSGQKWSDPVVWSFKFSNKAEELTEADAESLRSRYWADTPADDPAVESAELIDSSKKALPSKKKSVRSRARTLRAPAS